MSRRNLLVVGSGSAGKRHARNLAAMGCSISCVDPRADRRSELSADLGDGAAMVQGFDDVASALAGASEPFDGAVVASPTEFHVGQAQSLLAAGVPVLLEKPVSPGLAEATALQRSVEATGTPLLLGYTWRWWPPLLEARRRVLAGDLGQVVHARFHMAAHLADWHPWERYQDWFMADAAQGGGALLDESHWIDQMLWFFGVPERVFARIGNVSGLEITSDDNVDMVVEYADGPRVTMHLDLFARPHVKVIELVGEEGTLRWTPNELALGTGGAGDWETHTWDNERNDMFVAVAREFVGLLDGGAQPRAAADAGLHAGAPPSCTIDDGVAVLRVVEAARKADREGRSVAIVDVDADVQPDMDAT